MSRIAISAFSGWNDAGEAASGVVEHLLEVWPSHQIGWIDGEEFMDFQVNRPEIRTGEDRTRQLVWPGTRLDLLEVPDGPPIVLVHGPEPSLHWRAFADRVVGELFGTDTDLLLSLGALLTDSPHTRPLPVGVHSEPTVDEQVEEDLYDGPIGMPTVLARSAAISGLRTESLWVQVPHYVAQNASPKAVLALVREIQEHLDVPIPLADLEEEAAAWEHGVDELARTDPDIADYVDRLEKAQDASELPEASGDAIAREFEQFLRRRRRDGR